MEFKRDRYVFTSKSTFSKARDQKIRLQNFVASADGLNEHSYGEIKFTEMGRKVTYAPFVTASCDTDPSTIWNLLTRRWKLSPPSVVLGIFGEFVTHDQTWKSVTKGSWIITTGSSPFMNTIDATTIAIVEMGKVEDKEKFYSTSTKGKFPLVQHPRNTKDASSTKPLDRNHSFFIFVEGSSENVAEFRNNVLYYFSTVPIGFDSADANFSTIPLVFNLISDPPKPIPLLSANWMKHHVYVVHESAKLLTKFAKAVLYGNSSTTPDDESKASKEQLTLSFLNEIDSKTAEFFRDSVFSKEVPLFLYSSALQSKSFDQFILWSIASNDEYPVGAVLHLALQWTATEVIEKLLITREEFLDLKEGFLRECLILALKMESASYLEILFQHGVKVYSMLRAKDLNYLYDQSLNRKCHLTSYSRIVRTILAKRCICKKQHRHHPESLISCISHTLRLMTCHQVVDLYSSDPYMLSECYGNTSFGGERESNNASSLLEHPERDIFLWCILTGRDELAQAVWRHGRDPTALALIASVICGEMTAFVEEMHRDVIEYMNQLARGWEQRAMETISFLYKRNATVSVSLLIAKQQHLGGFSCLTLGFEGGKQDFMSSPPCQRSLDKIWRGKLQANRATYKIILSFFFPFVIPWLGLIERESSYQSETKAYSPTFSSETDHQTTLSESEQVSNDPSDTQSDSQLNSVAHGLSRLKSKKKKLASYREDVADFYSSPLIKHISHTIFRGIAIFILSFVIIVVNMRKLKILSVEIQLLVWYMAGNLCEIFRQILYSDGDGLKARLKLWVNNGWSWVDLVVICSFTIGLTLLFIQDAISDLIWVVAKFCLSVSLMGLYAGIIRDYVASKSLGPIMYMIWQMIRDTTIFLGLMALIFFSYGVVFYSLRFEAQPSASNTTNDQSLNSVTGMLLFVINNILREPYWQIYGNGLDDVIVVQTTLAGSIRAIFSAIYVMFSSILMVNLLVAMYRLVEDFSNKAQSIIYHRFLRSFTFDKIQERSYIVWSYYRYDVVREYADRPALPSPFILINHIVEMIRYVRGKVKPKACCKNFAKSEMQLNREIEQEVFMEFQTQNEDRFETDTLIKEMQKRQKLIEQKVDDLLAADRNK